MTANVPYLLAVRVSFALLEMNTRKATVNTNANGIVINEIIQKLLF